MILRELVLITFASIAVNCRGVETPLGALSLPPAPWIRTAVQNNTARKEPGVQGRASYCVANWLQSSR